jgi:hypothetical protein
MKLKNKVIELLKNPTNVGFFYFRMYSTFDQISISSQSKHWSTFSNLTSSTGSISGQLISGRIVR